jgi:hypothetical protein
MKVKINEKEFNVEKLALGKYAELLGKLDRIPQQLDGLDVLTEEKILAELPKMLKEIFPELIDVVSFGSGISKEVLETECGITDLAKIIRAIFEVNELKELGKVLEDLQGKKALGKASEKIGLKE